jgi:UDP-GlcNAc:undecaprenyl-phosphate GlcNAc-1-phosphate transferase
VSGIVAAAAGGLALALVLVRVVKPPWTSAVMRAGAYFFMPLVIYLGEVRPVAWIPPEAMISINLSFGLLTFLAIVTLRQTRRKEGFKVSPLDFIIVFIAAVVPNLPDETVQNFQLGLLAAKIIIFFVVFEVLIGELRGKIDKLGLGMVVALLILAGKHVSW